MRFSVLAAAAGLVGLGSARVRPIEDDLLRVDDVTSMDLLEDAGSAPLPFEGCKNVNLKDSVFEINEIHLSPNPPKVGNNVLITVIGNLKEEAPEKSVVTVTIKRGAVKLTKLQYDFCEGVNTTCPVKAGDVTFSKKQWLDPRLPTKWKYNVKVGVATKDKQQLACVKVPIKLAPKTILGHGPFGPSHMSRFYV